MDENKKSNTELNMAAVEELFEKQEKFLNEKLPKIIRKEIKTGFLTIGIDTGSPIEMQELISWAKTKKSDDERIKSRVSNVMVDWVTKGVILLIVLGFITFYTQSLVDYAIREEKTKMSQVVEGNKEK